MAITAAPDLALTERLSDALARRTRRGRGIERDGDGEQALAAVLLEFPF